MEPQYSSLLSPLDQFMPRTYTRIFLIFALENHDDAIEALRLGLSRTYFQAPYLKGHVYVRPHDRNQLGIAWTNDDPVPGFSEILAQDTLTYATLTKEIAPLHHFQSSLCPVGVIPDHSTTESRAAVFAASYSRIDGGLILCICVHHLVMDGTGIGELIRVIASNVRFKVNQEEPRLKLDPLEPLTRVTRLRKFQSSHSGDSDLPSWDYVLQRHPEFNVLASSPTLLNPSVVPQMPKGTSKIFRFPVAKLAAAKDVLCKSTNPKHLTSNTILSALIWSVITRVRFSRLKLPTTSLPKLGFAINGRKHLGDNFFGGVPFLGNVNLFGLATIGLSDIDATSTCCDFSQSTSAQAENVNKLIPIVTAISTAISHISPYHISEVIRLVEASTDVTHITPGWNSRNGPDLTLTSWANTGLYECDFGDVIGQPEFVRIPYAEFDGLVIILPRQRQVDEETIEAAIMLGEEDMETIERDEVWKSWTC